MSSLPRCWIGRISWPVLALATAGCGMPSGTSDGGDVPRAVDHAVTPDAAADVTIPLDAPAVGDGRNIDVPTRDVPSDASDAAPSSDVVARPDVHDAADVVHLPAPPPTWMEHWFEHVQLLHLVRSDDNVAIYFDPDVPASQAPWLFDYIQRVNHYVVTTYGPLSPTPTRLFAVFHQGRYGGGHPATYFDPTHDDRNTSDVGLDSWTSGPEQLDVPSHEIGHVVEFTVHGKHGSPAFTLWGDSKWMEFFQYDLYVGLGMTADAARFYAAVDANVDTFPRAGTRWFHNWFYPLWRDHGHARVMVTFYDLIRRYWPTDAAGTVHDMNWGEYVHFTSGAAGVNLKPLATAAFGWPSSWETQFVAARAAYPGVRAMYTYP